jgi:hypothetical protein
MWLVTCVTAHGSSRPAFMPSARPTSPYLVDFSTCDPARVKRYRSVSREELPGDLAAAQRHLASAVADVPDGDLARLAAMSSTVRLSLTDIFAFLPRHHADHVDRPELLGDALCPPVAAT